MSTDDLRNQLVKKLKDDLLAADLQWSLFAAAVKNYRHDSVLRPFPPMFLQTNDNVNIEKDFDKLEDVVLHFPMLYTIYQNNVKCLTNSQAELLSWVLDSKTYSLKSHDKSQFAEIKALTNHIVDVPAPNLVFEVIYSSSIESKFNEMSSGHELLYAYHGSNLENFYSILHNGLHSHLNKNSLFGEGTYLSSELSISLPYSRSAYTWVPSSLGELLSCVAVCQIIDHPDVKCLVKGKDSSCASVCNPADSNVESCKVPEKYYIVKNNEVLRVKYLLLYSSPSNSDQKHCQKKSIFSQYRFAFMMIFYFVLLIAIGLSNSQSIQFYFKKWMAN